MLSQLFLPNKQSVMVDRRSGCNLLAIAVKRRHGGLGTLADSQRWIDYLASSIILWRGDAAPCLAEFSYAPIFVRCPPA